MTPTTYGRDFAYCLKSHGGVRGFNASLWQFLLRCTLFCHSVATFLTSVSSYEGGCGFEDNETEYGKLYIDYPMVESIRYTKFLPDANYWTYTISRTDCSRFKGLSAEFSAYQSFDFILLTENREPTEDEIEEVKQNWVYLKEQNVSKANFLCNGENGIPASKDDILQGKIFDSQLEKYVNTEDCKVAVLNAFPLFIYDYFK